MHVLQATWGQAIKDISQVYLDGGDFAAAASDAAAELYGYGHADVLFKPTKAQEFPFRPTPTGALSYFVNQHGSCSFLKKSARDIPQTLCL